MSMAVPRVRDPGRVLHDVACDRYQESALRGYPDLECDAKPAGRPRWAGSSLNDFCVFAMLCRQITEADSVDPSEIVTCLVY